MGGPWYASGFFCFSGLTILIVGIILISTTASNEISLWFGVTLCECTGMLCQRPAGASSVDKPWVGYRLSPAQACPASLNEPQIGGLGDISFKLEKEHFSMDGLQYHPIVYRTEDKASLALQIRDSEGKVLLQSAGTLQLGDSQHQGALSVPQTAEAKAERPDEADETNQESFEQSSLRKLAKGGRSAGGPTRSRSGAAGRYGTGRTAYATPYGRTSCCVAIGTVVYVHRTGPRTRNGYYDSEEEVRTDCGDSETGCVFEVAQNIQRDELDDYSFVPSSDMKWPLTMTVSNATVAVLAKQPSSYEPELYITFWTEDPDNSAVAAYVLLPLGSLMVFAGLFIPIFLA